MTSRRPRGANRKLKIVEHEARRLMRQNRGLSLEEAKDEVKRRRACPLGRYEAGMKIDGED